MTGVPGFGQTHQYGYDLPGDWDDLDAPQVDEVQELEVRASGDDDSEQPGGAPGQ